ncbi:hypothetical protein [Bradyrhizobium sp. SZCCHNS3002]|uniref:hypothetical protein n=1 Tax=Bradyrhizobium sp. SZCCHNS3002 TaxID=3057310 RepID=UPI0028E29DB8|nr:hypothetical protein [Bradyrhizobium sp. SZCCHNS3002]
MPLRPLLSCFVFFVLVDQTFAQANLPTDVVSALRSSNKIQVIQRFNLDPKMAGLRINPTEPTVVIFADVLQLTNEFSPFDQFGTARPKNLIMIAREIMLGPDLLAKLNGIQTNTEDDPARVGTNLFLISRVLTLDASHSESTQAFKYQCYPKAACFDVSPGALLNPPSSLSAPPPPPPFLPFLPDRSGSVNFYFQTVEFSDSFRAALLAPLKELGSSDPALASTMIIPTAILNAVIEGFGAANPARIELGKANLNLSTVLAQYEKGLDWERSNRPQQFVGDRVGISLSLPNSPNGPPVRKVNFIGDFAAFVDLLPDKAFSQWAVANQKWLAELGQAAVLADDPVQARDFVDKVQHTLTGSVDTQYSNQYLQLQQAVRDRIKQLRRFQLQQIRLANTSAQESAEAVVDLFEGRVSFLPTEASLNSVPSTEKIYFGWAVESVDNGVVKYRLILEGTLDAPSDRPILGWDVKGPVSEIRFSDMKLLDSSNPAHNCGVQRNLFRCYIDAPTDMGAFLMLDRLASPSGITAKVSWTIPNDTLAGTKDIRLSLGKTVRTCLAKSSETEVRNNCAIALKIGTASTEVLQSNSRHAVVAPTVPVVAFIQDTSDLFRVFRLYHAEDLLQTIRFNHTLGAPLPSGDPLALGRLLYIHLRVSVEPLDKSIPLYTKDLDLAGVGDNSSKDLVLPRVGTTAITFDGKAVFDNGERPVRGQSQSPVITIQRENLIQ